MRRGNDICDAMDECYLQESCRSFIVLLISFRIITSVCARIIDVRCLKGLSDDRSLLKVCLVFVLLSS